MSILNDRQYRIIKGRDLHGLPAGQVFHGYIYEGVVFLDAGECLDTGEPKHTQCDPVDVQFLSFNHIEPAPHEPDLPMP